MEKDLNVSRVSTEYEVEYLDRNWRLYVEDCGSANSCDKFYLVTIELGLESHFDSLIYRSFWTQIMKDGTREEVLKEFSDHAEAILSRFGHMTYEQYRKYRIALATENEDLIF